MGLGGRVGSRITCVLSWVCRAGRRCQVVGLRTKGAQQRLPWGGPEGGGKECQHSLFYLFSVTRAVPRRCCPSCPAQELERREELYAYLHASLSEAASLIGERVLSTPNNPISIALTLDGLAAPPPPAPTRPQAPLHTSTPPPALISSSPSASAPCGPSSAAAAAGEGQESASAPFVRNPTT